MAVWWHLGEELEASLMHREREQADAWGKDGEKGCEHPGDTHSPVCSAGPGRVWWPRSTGQGPVR